VITNPNYLKHIESQYWSKLVARSGTNTGLCILWTQYWVWRTEFCMI
jgi:hypothetical protein